MTSQYVIASFVHVFTPLGGSISYVDWNFIAVAAIYSSYNTLLRYINNSAAGQQSPMAIP